MDTVALTSEIESALEQLARKLPNDMRADDVPVEFREAMLEHELSLDIQTLLEAQSEFASPRMVNSLSGATGFQPPFVAPMLLREARHRQSSEAAVAWLQKVLNTERAEGIAVETFWGFTPTESKALSDDVQLVPFSSLPPSRQKLALSEPRFDSSPRLAAPVFTWQAPTAALVRPAVIQPYLRNAGDNFQWDKGGAYSALFSDVRLCLVTSGPAAIVRGPGWFQYADPDLESARLGSGTYQTHQEITPLTMDCNSRLDVAQAATLFGQLVKLNAGQKNKARTAMQRLGLACLRRWPADRALELAIALEALLVDSSGENTFKIGLRAALLTASDLESRRRCRAIIEAMYGIRSSLMHSGQTKDICIVRGYGKLQTSEVVSEALRITALVIQRMIRLGAPPDWSILELSSPV